MVMIPTVNNVKAKVVINAQMCEVNDKSDPQKRPPTEGNQWKEKTVILSPSISISEWKSRMAAIKAIIEAPDLA